MNLTNELVEEAFYKSKLEDRIDYVARHSALRSFFIFKVLLVFIVLVAAILAVSVTPFLLTYIFGWILIAILFLVLLNFAKDYIKEKEDLVKKYLFKNKKWI